MVSITTSDNPFDPINQFDDWFRYDSDHGYNTLDFLGRVSVTHTDMTDSMYERQLERAIDEIVVYDTINMVYPDVHYVKVVHD